MAVTTYNLTDDLPRFCKFADYFFLFSKGSMNYSDLSLDLLNNQVLEWDDCKKGYDSLKTVKVKDFVFDGFNIKVQFNLGRMTSTSAKVDPKSIKERKCFLCKNNLPKAQKGLNWKDNFVILVNPFPIFPEHFTIPSEEHLPQQIISSFKNLNLLAYDLRERYITFYNGPKCGASAPDHIHFQAGLKNYIPLDYEYELIKGKYGKAILVDERINVFGINDGLRKFIAMESNSIDELYSFFSSIYSVISDSSAKEEPMLNIISNYVLNKWRVLVFLRGKHRPECFFAEGVKKLLLSPASVDVGGCCVVPREEDFDKITKEQVKNIFDEVFISDALFDGICSKL